MAQSPPIQRLKLTNVPTVAVVVSRYNSAITDLLLDGAKKAYTQRGGSPRALRVIPAPGAFELPFLSDAAARSGEFGGVLALGCLIKGETRHDRYIASAVANGLIEVGLRTHIPVAFGVLTVETPKQASARAGGSRGNKGEESMHALLDTIAAMRAMHRPHPSLGGARNNGVGPSRQQSLRVAPGAGTASRRGGRAR